MMKRYDPHPVALLGPTDYLSCQNFVQKPHSFPGPLKQSVKTGQTKLGFKFHIMIILVIRNNVCFSIKGTSFGEAMGDTNLVLIA